MTGGGGTGLRGTIDSVTGGGANGPIATFTIIDGGKDYVAGNVLTIVQAGGAGGSITLATAPNGAITTIAINAAGSNYSPGDIITVTQAGASGGTRAILTVQDLAPVAGDAVLFKGVPAGSILPVAVDYVLVANTTATDIVAGK